MPAQTTYSQEPGQAVEGQLACRYNEAEIITMYNGEASAQIPFGRAVMFDVADLTGKKALLPVSETAPIAGIVVHSHAHDPGENGSLGATGVKAGGKLSVLVAGTIWVKSPTATEPGASRLWVRGVAGGGESLGTLEDADDSTDTVDCTGQGRWVTGGAALALTKLAVNFTGK